MVRIVCEGSGDRKFLKLLLKHLGIDSSDNNFEKMNGKSFLLDNSDSRYEKLQEQIDIGKIEKLLFILDADCIENDAKNGGYDNSEKAIVKLIEDLAIKDLSDYFISCNPETKIGYIESLVLSTIPKEHKECIETFLKCTEPKDRKEDKFIIQTIYSQYYPNSGYNFEHENFKPLIITLKKLFKKEE